MASTQSTITITKSTVRYGREYVEYSDGSQWTRKLDAETNMPRGEWRAVESPVAEESEPSTLYLSVVVENQAPGEPKHWSLFSHRPDNTGRGKGHVWQVTGDAEHMHYQHISDVDHMNTATFAWHQVLNTSLTNAQYDVVDRIARSEPAPRAVNRAAVVENCQGWVIRVLRRLVDEAIVPESAVDMLQGYMDPLN